MLLLYGTAVSCHTGHLQHIFGPKGVWVLAEWGNAYGPLYKLHFLDEFVLCITDPDTIARITRRTGACGGSGAVHTLYAAVWGTLARRP